MRGKLLETIIGGIVLLSALGFVLYAFNESSVTPVEGYELRAEFNRVDGLVPGSDVRMSGIKIGTILHTKLDSDTYLAVVRINIRESVHVPADSSARIQADGLLGDSYLSIEPGGSDKMLEPGARITRTQDPLNLADLIGRFVFSEPQDEPAPDSAPEDELQPAPQTEPESEPLEEGGTLE
ncbi:MAG: outer membrane lipid asymmetry maintenance protein MlaD [Dongiaceae bacterium]